jgi:hypothetical protein
VGCRELDIFKILGFFWEIFGNFLGGIFWKEFFGRKFLGGILCEEFFWGNFLGGILWEEFSENSQ